MNVAASECSYLSQGDAVRNKDTIAIVEQTFSSAPPSFEDMLLVSPNDEARGMPMVNRINGGSMLVQEAFVWDQKTEQKYKRWARLKAVGRLNLEQKVEFERLSALRRGRISRSGEEILAEYEQRTLTKTLVQALSKYVKFHQTHAPNYKGKPS